MQELPPTHTHTHTLSARDYCSETPGLLTLGRLLVRVDLCLRGCRVSWSSYGVKV